MSCSPWYHAAHLVWGVLIVAHIGLCIVISHAAWKCRSYLEAEVNVDDPDRPVYLLGESFGAVLALAVAHDKTDLVDRLVLVNPATSYEKSIWPRLGPAVAKLPDVSLTV